MQTPLFKVRQSLGDRTQVLSRTPDPNHDTYSALPLNLTGYRNSNCLSSCLIQLQLCNGGFMAFSKSTWSKVCPAQQRRFPHLQSKDQTSYLSSHTVKPDWEGIHGHPFLPFQNTFQMRAHCSLPPLRQGCHGRFCGKVMHKVLHWTSNSYSATAATKYHLNASQGPLG